MKNLNEQKFREMIYAFSAGCLDKEESLDFLEYRKSGQKVPENELGELQNVVALLPVILELETPDARLKDKVARRLYRMREELRAKKRQMVKDIKEGETGPLNKNVFSEKVYEKPEEIKEAPPLKTTGRMTVENPVPKTEPFEKRSRVPDKPLEVPYVEQDNVETESETSSSPRVTGSYGYTGMDTLQEAPLGGETETAEPEKAQPLGPKWAKEEADYEEEEKSVRSFRNIMILSVILALVLISGGIIYYLMNRQIRQGREQIASLSGQVNALNSEMLRLDRNQKVLAVLSAKDLRTINLDGTDGNPGGFGKLSLLQNGNEGVIQFYNMPPLKDGEVYQLWLTSKSRSYSLGTFKTKREVEYFPFATPEIPQNEVGSYLVTLEEGEGKTSPSDKVYLMTKLSER